MFKIAPLFLTALILAGEGLGGAVRGPIDEIESLVEGIKQYVEEEKSKAVTEFHDAVSEVFNRFRHETTANQQQLAAVYDTAIEELSSMPAECVPPSLKHSLTVLKSSGLGDFFHCPKLLTGLTDVGAIISDTVKLVFELISTGVDFMSGFSKCKGSWAPWKFIPCYYEHAKKIIVDIKTSVQMIKEYGSTVSALGHNISEIITFCRNSSVQHFPVHAVMAPVYACAKRPMPVQLYQLN